MTQQRHPLASDDRAVPVDTDEEIITALAAERDAMMEALTLALSYLEEDEANEVRAALGDYKLADDGEIA